MPLSDLTREIPRFEAEDTFQFTLTMSANRPESVQFMIFGTDGATVAPVAVQTGLSVAESGANTGIYHVERILPSSAGLYAWKFVAFDAASRTYPTAGYFEVYKTVVESFYTYSDISETVRSARQIFGSDLTIGEMRRYFEEADAWIDTKLRPVATVPVSPTPNFLRGMSQVGAQFMYLADHGPQKSVDPAGIVRRWEEYNTLLDAIVAGSASLVAVDVSDRPIDIANDGYKPIFDFREPEEQRIDPDLIQDNEDQDT